MTQLTETTSFVTLVATTCANCGITYGLPQNFAHARQNDHTRFWCPNGHSQYFPGESDAEKAERLRKQEAERRRAADARAVHLRDQLQAERRTAAALRGHLTRARNRIANGVCPVAGCRRHFDNVQAHIATKHPDYHLEVVPA